MRSLSNSQILWFCLTFLIAPKAQAAPPVNDNFANRTVLSGATGQIDATNVNATNETNEPLPFNTESIVSGKSVWWGWTAPTNGQVTILTCGSSFDTLLAVYTGTSLTNLTLIAKNNDFCRSQSGVIFDATAGLNYKIAVSGVNSTSGDISLSWELKNDNFKLNSIDFNPAAPDSAQPGEPLNLVRWNITGVNTAKPVWLELFASNTGGFTFSRFGGTITNSHSLNGYTGGTSFFNPTQTLNWLPDGIYTVVGFVNRPGTGGPSETNYADNWYPLEGKRLRVRNNQLPNCNLVLENPTYTRDGTFVRVTGTVRNTGPSATPDYGFWIETAYGYLSAEGNFLPVGYIGGGVKVGRLEPNGVYNYSQIGTSTVNATLAIMADSTDIVPETEERDNWDFNGWIPGACGTTVDVGFIDAYIQSTQLAPAELSPTDKVTVNFSIINRSSEDSGWLWVEFFASQTGGLSTLRSGVPLLESRKINVRANRTGNWELHLNIEGIPDGIYSVVGIVNRCGVPDNPGDKIPYLVGGDNLFRLPGRVILRNGDEATANIHCVSTSVSVSPSRDAVINVSVRNSGTGLTRAFWTEAFYGLVDNKTGEFKPQGQISGGVLSPPLSVGSTAQVSITGKIPVGLWVIGGIADSTDLVPETDETDNWFLHAM